MKKILISIFIISLPFTASLAQNIERAKKTIATLSSKQMHGRSPAFEGDQKAALYITKLFKKAGLKPVKGTYSQPFSYDTQIFPKKMFLSINGKKLVPGKDYIIDPVSSTSRGKAELFYLDSSFFYSTHANISEFSFEHKAVVYDQKYYSKLNELPLELIQKIYSASCIIEYNHKKLTMSVASKPLSIPIFKLGTQFVNDIPSGYCSFDLSSEWKQDYSSQNIVGTLKGSIQPDSFIVLTAHYDHLGHLGKKTYFPGANDNASGIAMLNELANFYSDTIHHSLRYSVLFIAFGGEEAGLIGSQYFCQHPLIDLKSIKFLINMDIVGTGDESITVVNATEYPKEFHTLDSLNKNKQLIAAINKRGKAANSDHYYFSQRGVPAFFIYTNGKQKAYHDVYDIPKTLPLTKFKELFSLLTLFIESIQ